MSSAGHVIFNYRGSMPLISGSILLDTDSRNGERYVKGKNNSNYSKVQAHLRIDKSIFTRHAILIKC